MQSVTELYPYNALKFLFSEGYPDIDLQKGISLPNMQEAFIGKKNQI